MNWPASHIVFYDGSCGICSGTVQRILRNDRRGLFKVCPIASELGARTYRELGLSPEDPNTFVAVIDGKPLMRSTAALAVARALGGPWRLLLVFRLLPTRWADSLYDWVARNRHRFGKSGQACSIVGVDRSRFLN